MVAPGLPVAVLLGRDLYEPAEGESPVRGFAVDTRSAKRRAKKNAVVQNQPRAEGKVNKDETATPSAVESTADCEIY